MAVDDSEFDWTFGNVSNSTGPNATLPEPYVGAAAILENLPVSVPTILTYAVCFLLGTVGNVLVIFSVARFRRLRSTTNYLLGNLATADLLIVALCVPVKAAEFFLPSWQLGGFLCKATALLQFLSVICSVLTLTCISIERYFAIIYPMQIRSVFTVSRARLLIAAIWVVSFLFASPALVSQTLVEYDWGTGEIIYHCQQVWPTDTHRQLYSIYGLLLLFVLPMATMGLSYGRIIREILRRRRKVLRQRVTADAEVEDEKRSSSFVRQETVEELLTLPHSDHDLPTPNGKGGRLLEIEIGKVNKGYELSPRNSNNPHLASNEESAEGGRKDSGEEALSSAEEDEKPARKSSKDLLRKYKSLPVELDECRRQERLEQRRNTDADILDHPLLLPQDSEEEDRGTRLLERLRSFRRTLSCRGRPRTSSEETDKVLAARRRVRRVAAKRESSMTGNFYKSTHVLADEEGMKILRMLLVVVFVFALCWCPRLILLTLTKFNLVNVHTELVYAMDITFHLMTYLNSCVNPVCYAFMSRHFRQSFKDTMSSNCKKKAIGRQGTPDILLTTTCSSKRRALDITATVSGLTDAGTTRISRASTGTAPSRISVTSYGRTSTTTAPPNMCITTEV
ncbi:gastrin/cholecystokinin type B receptor-like [Branchiostoma floridae]|uniref:Gastrin/cholecystokinin type B receptor-like n=1 Tax=Branchiostoma floridae TaxID=7739 RepID=A0A9J7MD89_BRAFL|nr:gastrin/cholecystokinin type B receptor-like [Branchiostoma floridae]